MRVREGDQVKAGDVIAIIDDEQIRAREQQAQSAVDQAAAQLRSARQQIAILNEQLSNATTDGPVAAGVTRTGPPGRS